MPLQTYLVPGALSWSLVLVNIGVKNISFMIHQT